MISESLSNSNVKFKEKGVFEDVGSLAFGSLHVIAP